MANAPPAAQDALSSDLQLADDTIAAGVVPSCNQKAIKTWSIWIAFCASINVDPYLSQVADPVIVLQTFGLLWQDGRISPSKNPNRACSVEDTIQLVGQKFSSLGSKELNQAGSQEFHLTRMYSAWKKEDDPPARVEPIAMTILLQAESI